MSQGNELGMSVGAFHVVTTTNAGHPPEFYAERIVERLIYVSDQAPPEIKAQALAYRESLKSVVHDGIRRAIRSHHTTLIAKLRKAGMEEAASFIWELGAK